MKQPFDRRELLSSALAITRLEGEMAEAKAKREPAPISAGDDHEVDQVVRHYGVTREQARRLIREHGANRRELEAAAGRLSAKRSL
jgi:hypothetical protein